MAAQSDSESAKAQEEFIHFDMTMHPNAYCITFAGWTIEWTTKKFWSRNVKNNGNA